MLHTKFDDSEPRPFVGIKIPKDKIDIALHSDNRAHKINNLLNQMDNKGNVASSSMTKKYSSQKCGEIMQSLANKRKTKTIVLPKGKLAIPQRTDQKFPLSRKGNKTMTIKEIIDDRRAPINFQYESELFNEKFERNSKRIATISLIDSVKKEKDTFNKDFDIEMNSELMEEINKEYQDFEAKIGRLFNNVSQSNKKESNKILVTKRTGKYPVYIRNQFRKSNGKVESRKANLHKQYQDLYLPSLTIESANNCNCTANTQRNSTFTSFTKASQNIANSLYKTKIYNSVGRLQDNLEDLQSSLNRERLNTDQCVQNEIRTQRLIKPELHDINDALYDEDKQAFVYSKCKGQYTKLSLNGDHTIIKCNDKETDNLIGTVNAETVYKFRGLLQKGDYRIMSKVEPMREKITKMKERFKTNAKVRQQGLNQLKSNSFRILQLSTRFKSNFK